MRRGEWGRTFTKSRLGLRSPPAYNGATSRVQFSSQPLHLVLLHIHASPLLLLLLRVSDYPLPPLPIHPPSLLMKEHWLEVLEWIQLAITLAFLVVMAGILVLVLRYHKLEFNVLWKTRAFIVSIAIMWAFSLLLGRQQLWSPNDGLLSSSSSKFEGLCRAHVFLTFGIWQPLFFITILMVLRSKERYGYHIYSYLDCDWC